MAMMIATQYAENQCSSMTFALFVKCGKLSTERESGPAGRGLSVPVSGLRRRYAHLLRQTF